MAERRLDIVIAAQSRTAGTFAAELSRVRAFASVMTGLAGALPLAGVGLFLGSAVKQFGEAEKAASDLNVALEAQGEKAAATAAGVEMFAKRMQDATTVEDDAVIALSAYIARLGQLSGEGLQSATQQTLGLARATGLELEPAAKAYLKSLEGSYTALTKAIPKLAGATDNIQRAAIVSKTAALGLRLMAADAQTTTGAMTRLKVMLGNTIEGIGAGLSPVVKALADAVLANSGAWTAWGENIGMQIKAADALARNLWAGLRVDGLTALVGLSSAWDTAWTAADNFFSLVNAGAKNMQEAVAASVKNMLPMLNNLFNARSEIWAAISGAAQNAASSLKPFFAGLGEGASNLYKQAQKAWETGDLNWLPMWGGTLNHIHSAEGDKAAELLKAAGEKLGKVADALLAGTKWPEWQSATLKGLEDSAGTVKLREKLAKAIADFDNALSHTFGEKARDESVFFEEPAGAGGGRSRGRRGGDSRGIGASLLSKNFLGLADTFASEQAQTLRKIEANTQKAAEREAELVRGINALNAVVARAQRNGPSGLPLFG